MLDETLARLRSEGYTPYASTREPFSRLAGTIAYTEASIELRDQLGAAGVTDGSKVHLFLVGGTSSAGLALGGKLLGFPWRVHPVSVGGSANSVRKMVLDLADRAATLLDFEARVGPDDLDVHDQYVGERYGDTPPTTLEAIKLAARTDAIFMDPCTPARPSPGSSARCAPARWGRTRSRSSCTPAGCRSSSPTTRCWRTSLPSQPAPDGTRPPAGGGARRRAG